MLMVRAGSPAAPRRVSATLLLGQAPIVVLVRAAPLRAAISPPPERVRPGEVRDVKLIPAIPSACASSRMALGPIGALARRLGLAGDSEVPARLWASARPIMPAIPLRRSPACVRNDHSRK
jgi:hypothetical protein